MSDNVSNRRVHSFEPNSTPAPQYGPQSHGSEHSTTPVDDEGIPFMSTKDIAHIHGRSPLNAKRIAWETDAPHYVYNRGQIGAKSPNTSVFISHGETVNYLEKKAAFHKPEADRTHEEKMWGALHAEEAPKYLTKKKAVAASIKAGGPRYNFSNQPHPNNQTLTKARLTPYPKGRIDENATSQLGEITHTSDTRRAARIPAEPVKASRAKRRTK
jgi:hypothetical protein